MKQAIEARRPSLVEAFDGRAPQSAAAPQRQPIVVVIGMHRSGTSLCSHILSVLGVDMTDDIDAQPSNPRGQWERLALRELQDRILDLFDRGFLSPHHDLPLPAGWWADPRVRAPREQIVAFLRQRMPQSKLFGFKDPRTARLLPLWQQIFEELRLRPRYVLCLRNPAQVARSLNARDGFSPEVSECRWFCYMVEALGNLPDGDVCNIEYEDWFLDPQINFDKLSEFLDLPSDGAAAELRLAVSQIVDPYLRHDQPGADKARQPLVQSLYEGAREAAENPLARDSVRALTEQFSAFRELYRPIHDELERTSKQRAADIARLENAELASLRAELDQALQISGHFEEIAEAAQAAIDMLRHKLAQAERDGAERTALAEGERDNIRDERDRLAAERDALERQHEAACDERNRLGEERDALARQHEAVRDERDRLSRECDALMGERDGLRTQRERLAAEGALWFDGAVQVAMERLFAAGPRPGWRIGRYRVQVGPIRGRGSPLTAADRARDARQWGRAARLYLEALEAGARNRSAIFVQLGHAFAEAGRIREAEIAYKRALDRDASSTDALAALGNLLRREGRHDEAAALSEIR